MEDEVLRDDPPLNPGEMLPVNDLNKLVFHVVLHELDNSKMYFGMCDGTTGTLEIKNLKDFHGNAVTDGLTMETKVARSVEIDGHTESLNMFPVTSNQPLVISDTDQWLKIWASDYREFDLEFTNTYDLKVLSDPAPNSYWTLSQLSYDGRVGEGCFNLEELNLRGWVSGNSMSLLSLPKLKTLRCYRNVGISWNMSYLRNMQSNAYVLFGYKFNGFIPDHSIVFNTSGLSQWNALAKMRLENFIIGGTYQHQFRGITGSLSHFSGFINLRQLEISYTNISGNVSSLAACQYLERLYCAECDISGDLSTLPSTCYAFSNNVGYSSQEGHAFEWKNTRTGETTHFLAIPFEVTICGDDLVKMVQDQNGCGGDIDNSNKIIVRTDDNSLLSHKQMLLSILTANSGSNKIFTLRIDGVTCVSEGVVVLS